MGSGLFHTLNIGEQSLYNTRQGVDTASHNISNANTAGYSRQRVNLKTRQPQYLGGVLAGSGSYIENITRTHNKFVERQLNRAQQSSGEATGRFDGLKSLESIFSPELASGVPDEIGNFFNSLQDLSLSPSDEAIRNSVRENAKSVTSAFKRVNSEVNQRRSDLNEMIVQECVEINSRLNGIRELNIQIQDAEASPGAVANDLRDQRDMLLRELTEKVQINYYEDDAGNFCIRGPDDTLLVDKTSIAEFTATNNGSNDGFADIVIQDKTNGFMRNITRKMEGGRIKGLIEVRDNVCAGLINKNNEMAANFVGRVNDIHAKGFGIRDYDETAGRHFFKPITDINKAASEIDVSDEILGSTDAISVAATPLAVGDNIVANELLSLKTEKFLDDGRSNLVEFYANYVGNLGVEINRTEHLKDANDLVVSDLQAQRDASAGVSLDEEAISLMKWQSNFTASSKVITTVDEMLETVLSLKR
ncbi:MAG: flagellar hook-associated protein FlgK [bacterium]